MVEHEYFHDTRVDYAVLEHWIEAGWVTPEPNAAGRRLSDADLARARLIRDLKDMGVNDESMPIVLDLVDQLHGVRCVLRELLSTMKAQWQGREGG